MRRHCLAQFVQENRAKPIVVRLTGREADLHWQTICIHDGVNLGRQLAHSKSLEITPLQPPATQTAVTGAGHRLMVSAVPSNVATRANRT
jgi:hypothetical protein